MEYKFQQKQFNFSEILPQGYNLLVCSNSDRNLGTLYPKAKKIIIAGSLASVGSLLILLHEVGHIHDFDKLEKIGAEQLTEGGLDFENSSAEELRKEREASLYALRKMWPIFKDNPEMKADVIMYAKNLAYASYGEHANDIRNVRLDDGGWEDWEND